MLLYHPQGVPELRSFHFIKISLKLSNKNEDLVVVVKSLYDFYNIIF